MQMWRDPMDLLDDINALAELGWGPEQLEALNAAGMPAGAFAFYRSLDTPTRDLVLRLLGHPVPEVLEELALHPDFETLSAWLGTLPLSWPVLPREG
jgi:hypothetical protein